MKYFLILLMVSSMIAQTKLSYQDVNQPIEKRVEDLLSRMTLDEKIDLLGGTGFATKPIPRLGIPELRMTDGPVGVRWGASTAFPSSIAMAATWDPELISGIGSAIAREVKGKGRHVILGPCVNIARLPMWGRNFEGFGEDPFLASRMTVEYIKGVQKEGVAATVKHFAANNQEHERMFVDVLVSERALNEIYFPAFKAAVTEADVLCVMSAYNKVNQYFSSENDYLLIDKLKKEWGFKGLVMSDWGAVHSSLPTAKGGCDLEMPTGIFMNKENLLPAIESGELSIDKIDEKVRRILKVIFKLGLFDTPEWRENPALVNSAENRKIAYETALASIVLLKNDNGLLPLNKNKLKSIAVIGPSAEIPRTSGGGSAYVTPINPVSPLTALKNKLPKNININYAPGVILPGDAKAIPEEFLFTDETQKTNGVYAEYFDNIDLSGEPKVRRIDKNISFIWSDNKPVEGIGNNYFSIRWTGYLKAPESGEFIINTSTDDGVRLWFNDELIIDDWTDHAVMTISRKVNLEKGKLYKIKMEFYEKTGNAAAILGWQTPSENLMKEAINIAKQSDVVLLFVGTSDKIETEGMDRPDLILPGEQEELIQKISEVNRKTIVILTSGAPILMDKWINQVNSVIEMWFAGTEGGNAIVDVLFGNYNPSGKLPVTFPKRWEDCSAFDSYKKYPARTYYTDDIYVGYRHFDKNNIEPLFPFGFGLSYTTFEYSNIMVEDKGDKFQITIDLKNTGTLEGAEVVQLYVSQKNPKVDRPFKELKAFKKVFLKPGETQKVTMELKKESLSYYNESSRSWQLDKDDYEILVGSSSRDIKLKYTVSL